MDKGNSRTARIMQMLKDQETENRSSSCEILNQASCSYATENKDIVSCSNEINDVLESDDEEFYDSDADPAYIPVSPLSTTEGLIIQTEVDEELVLDASENNDVNPNKRLRSKRGAPNTWIRNIRKVKRNSGNSYTTTANNIRPERHSKNIGIECKCVHKCHLTISDEGKIQICNAFWKIGDLSRQRDFIVTNVECKKTLKGRVVNSRRQFTLMYFLKFNGMKNQVCKKFFLDTLDISEKMVRTALYKANRNVVDIPSPDKRGRHVPGIKHKDDTIKFAENHIDSFPRVPAHWCRKDTKKEYLESILNKEKMYSLYKEHCMQMGQIAISKTSYRELLIKKNIGFHVPKKDQCWCHHFEQIAEYERPAEKVYEYQLHIRRKVAAIEEKKSDALKAKRDSSYVSANFDLEAVLYSPLLFAKPVFYKRKLATFNFTIYEIAKQQGHCFVWPEYEGNRGANEISTCLEKFIQTLPDTTHHLVLHSDCCPGQNRNSIVACMLLEAVKHTSIKIIDLKFLEPGHTHMECDSMHATIERASEYTKIFWPNSWVNVIRLANKKKPYNVNVLTHTDFLDYKEFKNKIMLNCTKNEDNCVLNWREVKWLRFEKENPNHFQYKNEYWNEFQRVDVTRKGRKTKTVNDRSKVQPLYRAPLPINKKKFENLQEMCKQKDAVIPAEYHHFYDSLPVHNVHRDLPEESDSDEEITLQTMKEKLLARKTKRNY